MAVATHISKNDDRERISKTVDNVSPTKTLPEFDKPLKFVTYETIGYGCTIGDATPNRYDSRYVSDTARLRESSDNDMVYSMTIKLFFEVNHLPNKKTNNERNTRAER
jgi:hypothetical protein